MKRVVSLVVAIVAGFLLFGAKGAFADAADCTAVFGANGTYNAGLDECQVTGTTHLSGTDLVPVTLDETLHLLTGATIVVDSPSLVLNLSGAGHGLVMDAGSVIDGGDPGCGGPNTAAFPITINSGGDVTLAGPSGQTPGALIRSDGCSGGAIVITTPPGYIVDIDGTVESVGTESGTGATQPPGGGPIRIVAGCSLTVSDTGRVSSRGKDPGADLVHLEGCSVTINGLVESTGSGHADPNHPANHCNLEPAAHPPGNDPSQFYTGCVEIWSGTTVTIDSTGTHTGEVNADVGFSGGTTGRGWIDIYANGNITIKDGTGNDRNALVPPVGPGTYFTSFAVHSNGGIAQNTDDGGLITIKSLGGDVSATSDVVTPTGGAIQADALSAGSNGGEVHVEAFNNVTFNAALFARGDFNGTGGFGDGGDLGTTAGGAAPIRAFNGALNWTTGVGDVRPTGSLVPAAQRGEINLEGCTALTATGSYPVNGVVVAPFPATTGPGGTACVGGPPQKATAGALPSANCFAQACGASKSGTKFEDLNGNHKRDALESGLPGWTIKIFDSSNTLVDTQVTDAFGNYFFGGLLPGSYTVCEVPQAGYTQTCPQAGSDCDLIATTTANCSALTGPPATVGYAITLGDREHETGNDFGNFKDAHKSGKKFNSNDNSAIPNWPINLYKLPQNTFVTTNTDGSGNYSFTISVGGDYRVCEGTGPAGFTQTFPNGSTVHPGETVASTCPAPNVWGYEFTVTSGATFTGDDFGNKTDAPPVCPEDPNRAPLLTRTVGTGKAGGTGAPGSPIDYATVQAAYNAAKGTAQVEVIGMFSNTNENLLLDGAKSLTITQCTSARVTGAAGSPVWNITNSQPLTIIGPDSVGGTIGWLVAGSNGHTLKSIRANGASKYGVQILSNSNSVSWNDVSGNGTTVATDAGIRVDGGSNTLKGSTIGSNKGDGVQLVGSSNNLSGATIQSNSGNGVLVSGSSNTVQSNSLLQNVMNGVLVSGSTNQLLSNSSDSGKGNKLHGIQVASGTNNQLTGNKMNGNVKDGINVAAGATLATGTKLKGNVNTGNTLNEFTIGANSTDQTGNKSNGAACTFTAAAKNCN